MHKCRVCNQRFFDEPLLRYENMPRAAQFLPDSESLASDKGVDLQVCQCSGCGLVQLNNDPVPYYKEVIRAAAFSEEMKDFRKRQFSSFIQNYSLEKKKFIEIGCGRGEYLSLVHQLGIDAYGLEYSDTSVKQCLQNGLKVSKGFIDRDTDSLENAPFDAFAILNFLEHLPDPNAMLRGIYDNLTDNAVGLIEVPNFDMILRNKLFSEFIGDHLTYFSRGTLIAALTHNGFEVVDCNEIWYDYIISAIVKKRRKLDLSDFHKHQMQLKSEMEQYIRGFDVKKVAIWGAGHQALAIISITGISDRIKYVVDSAPFKQNKYTPATHIRIVSPDALASDPVDAVIIMAAGYSNEVASLIRRKFDRNIDIAILRDFGLEFVQDPIT